jgi:putative FmdB family regulatory protein
MPTYEYECEACGHAFEKFQSMTDKVLRKCPECGKTKLHRLIGTGAGIIFKGSGFYETDYRSSDYQSAAKKERDGATPAASTVESKSDTAAVAEKPAGKPDKKESTKKADDK